MSSYWIGIEELAEELRVPVRTVYAWRVNGKGPRAAKFGKYLRFRREDIDVWIESRLDPVRDDV